MRKVKVIITSPTTLELVEDAKKGDIIDLQEVTEIDLSSLQEKIKSGKEVEYNRLLENYKKELDANNKVSLLEVENKYQKQILELESKIEMIQKEVKANLQVDFEKEKGSLNLTIQSLRNELNREKENKINEINLAINRKELELSQKINELSKKLDTLKLESDNEKKDIEASLKEVITERERQIAILRNEKSSLSVKRIGEELEHWCKEEYETYSLNGFETCTFEKDNFVINKTKADYIFRVYASNELKPEEELTSVVLEMKSEAPNSVNKTKNADHYRKLDQDRINKNAEYALLVSELEMDVTNDAPIRKVPGYDKMYMVRPQYFITFLSIIAALGLKYKDILVEHNKEELQFKDAKDILEEFEEMKNDILDKTIVNLEKNIMKISDASDTIIKQANVINESVRIILENTISTIKNKINNFKISRVTNKIEKLDE